MSTHNRKKNSSKNAQVGANTMDSDKSGVWEKAGSSTPIDVLFRPLNRNNNAWITVVSIFWEISASALFTFFTILAFSGNNAETNRVLAGFLVGVISGGTLYLVFGLNSKQDVIPRHVMWTVTLFHVVLMRTGPIAGIILMVAQAAGAFIAAAFLWWMATTNTVLAVYPGAPTAALIWFYELLGVSVCLIVYFCFHMNGTDRAEEYEKRRTAQMWLAATRAGFLTVLLQNGLYSFEPLVYLAGLIATCGNPAGSACADTVPIPNAPAFFIMVPWIGVIIAAFLSIVGLIFNNWYGFRSGEDRNDESNIGRNISANIKSGLDELEVPYRQ